MKSQRVLLLAGATLLLAACAATPPKSTTLSPGADADIAHYFDTVRDNPPLLQALLRRFPKGGDLHNHLSGAIYAESLIAWGSESGLCIERTSFRLGPKPCGGERPALAEAVEDAAFYAATIDAFSMRDFVPAAGISGHDHFFATFDKFGPATDGRTGDMLAEAVLRAAADSAGYVELMLSPGMADARKLGAAAGWDDDLVRLEAKLDHAAMAKIVAAARGSLDQAEARSTYCSVAAPRPPSRAVMLPSAISPR